MTIVLDLSSIFIWKYKFRTNLYSLLSKLDLNMSTINCEDILDKFNLVKEFKENFSAQTNNSFFYIIDLIHVVHNWKQINYL